jgi:imidazole glycerol-phosphate synthase subunit HisH
VSSRIGVIDYGAGNIGSILNMISHVGGTPFVVSEPSQIEQADRLILPGVGHFDHGIRMLKDRGLFNPLRAHDAIAQPLLGICLGMQLLLSASEEGDEPGLGLVPGECRRFRPTDSRLKVPHMGWNVVRKSRESAALAPELDESRYYFVHTYYAAPEAPEHVAGVTHYDVDFCSVVDTDHGVSGYQFHPEKSHRFGMALLRAFAVPSC